MIIWTIVCSNQVTLSSSRQRGQRSPCWFAWLYLLALAPRLLYFAHILWTAECSRDESWSVLKGDHLPGSQYDTSCERGEESSRSRRCWRTFKRRMGGGFRILVLNPLSWAEFPVSARRKEMVSAKKPLWLEALRAGRGGGPRQKAGPSVFCKYVFKVHFHATNFNVMMRYFIIILIFPLPIQAVPSYIQVWVLPHNEVRCISVTRTSLISRYTCGRKPPSTI